MHQRLFFWFACLGVLLVLLSAVSSLLDSPVAYAASPPSTHPHLPMTQPSTTGVSGPRVSPNLTPQSLPVGAWNASQGAYGPKITTVTPTTKGRKPGEQPDLRTETSQTILNANGTWTLKSYGAPIHYKDAQGHWQPIDSSLVGDSSVAGYAYGNKANGWHVHFAAQAGGPTLVHATFPTVTMQETLQGPAKVPAHTSGSGVTYPGVFPGTDLLYKVSSSNLEELLLLQNAQGPTSYTFVYHIPGASATQDASGNVIFSDAQGKVLLVVGGLFMYESDAKGQMLPQGLGSQAVQISLASQSADFLVTLTPDQQWLKDPKRHFPVAIDPSQTWSGGNSGGNTTDGNVYASANDESAYPNNGYGNNQLGMRIGNCNYPDGTGTSRAYLKFPIGGPPANVHVTSANLAIYQTSMYGGGLGATVYAQVIGSAWNATNLTWNNHPSGIANAGNLMSTTTATTQLSWVNWDVSQAASLWWQGGVPLNGFVLSYANENQQCQFFESDNNGSNRPTLTINYVQDQTPPTGSLTINNGATSTNSPAVTVGPSALDPGSINEWNSNWTSVNGVTTNAANVSVDSSQAQLISDTSGCGSNACFAQTFFSHTMNVNNWPTFTAMFKVDNLSAFQFGVISGDNSGTRLVLTTPFGSNGGFNQIQVSTSAGSWNAYNINTIPLSVNTWYYAQFSFPLSTVGAVTIWQAGNARPATPTDVFPGMYMTNPGLNIWDNGDNGANLHHIDIGSVTMTSRDTNSGTTGFGVQQMSVSGDGSNWTCPPYGIGGWCIYSNQSYPWTFPGGDGKKTLWYQFLDNTGNGNASGTTQIIYDTTPPVVNSLSPGTGNEVRGIATIQVNATDPAAPDGSSSGVASAVLYVDGVQAGSPVSGTSAPTFLWDTTLLSQGVHILTAKATDAAGNVGIIGGSTTLIVSNTSGIPSAMAGGINLANGDAIVSQTDVAVPGRGPSLSITRTYHSLGTQLSLFGHGWSSTLDEGLSFPGDGSVSFIDAGGGFHSFLPNGSGGYLTSPGLYITLVKNGDGTYTLSARDQSKTNFNTSGQLSSVVDRHGNTLTISYTGGFPTTVTDASGRTLSITVTGGTITQITDPGGRVYKYDYFSDGFMADSIDPSGIDMAYAYTSSTGGLLRAVVRNYLAGGPADAQTNVTTNLIYDSANRLVQVKDPLGYDTNFSYSTVGSASQTTVRRLKGISPATYATSTILLTTDGRGAVAKVTDALNNVTQVQYDANENVTQVTDAVGRVTTSTYDGNGNALTHVVDPGSSPHLNLITSMTYDAANNVVTTTSPLGIVSKITYDSPTTGNPTTVVANYVLNGPITSDTNVTATITYDSLGEPITATDPLGVVAKTTYDTQGGVLSTTANATTGGSGTQYKRAILLDNTANAHPLSNYQLSFLLDTTSLIAVGKLRSDCGDLRINDSNDATAINNYWVENCNSSATVVWVKIPSIPASATKTIYLHYGNSSATSLSSISNTFVRDIPNTLADWPMHESSGTTVADATGNGYTGTATTTTGIVPGQFGNARSFNGLRGYIQTANEATLPFGTSARTVCAWALTNSLTGVAVIFDSGTTGTDQYFGIGRKNADLAGFGWNDDFYVPNFFKIGTWNQV
ncbi:MAG: DUF2341 domain-containing protein, partial [Ktedonobacteraceae bacterium]